MQARIATFVCLLCAAGAAMADSLTISPASPTPLDTVRLVYAHAGCTDPNSVQVAQATNLVTVQADRIFVVDCGTVSGYSESFSLGRLPSGTYDVQLVVNPPPGTLGPSLIVGPVHFAVASLPSSDPAHPHDNYGDLWWNPAEPGWALSVAQSGEKLFLVWNVYDGSGQPTWFAMPSGTWTRDANKVLSYSGTVFRTSGPAWQGSFDPNAVTSVAVGTAKFTPTAPERALLGYTIAGISATKQLRRFQF